MSTIKVDGIRSNSATSDAITLASDGTCTANITSINGGSIGTKNLIINGAMNVAQRGTSSDVSSTAYGSVDRFQLEVYGLDNPITMAQVDVASGETPYTLGFRKALKLTNGNQTSVGNTDTVRILHKIEAQDIAQSGWNHKSASSFITLSFWVKSSIAQSFKVSLIAWDGSTRTFVFDTGSLTANTWTKVTKTIPGNSNVTIDNDNGAGLQLSFHQYLGTNYTASSGYIEDQWNFYQNPQTPDQTNTWYDTDDATFELTGIQLEVGSVATDFEHRSFTQELALCQRYFYQHLSGNSKPVFNFVGFSSAGMYTVFHLPQEMRANPSMVQTTGSNYYTAFYQAGATDTFDGFNSIVWNGKRTIVVDAQTAQGVTTGGKDAMWAVSNNASASLAFNSEL